MTLTSRSLREAGLASLLLVAVTVGVGVAAGQAAAPAKPAAQAPAKAAAPATPAAQTSKAGQAVKALYSQTWVGDFDGMVKRRKIRILAPYSKTQYFIDRGVPRGLVAEMALLLEQELNKKLKTTHATKVLVVVVPTTRDDLANALLQGRGDIIAAGLTVTPEREKVVDFTIPVKRNVREIVVTGPGAPALATVDDLAGLEVAVREKSIQFETLQRLNETFTQQGKAPIRIRTVPTALEDEDILEMANAGLLKIVVVDEPYADLWKQILPGITPHPAMAVREAGDIAWAVRTNSPLLLAELNPILKANGEGTLFGNVLFRKYLQDIKIVKSATSETEIAKFNQLVSIFRKYSDKYGADYLLMMAQGYQESQLDQSVKSPVGAIGVMQVMPATGKQLKVGDITQVDANIEAGVKYMRFMMDQYFKDEPMAPINKVLFAFACYNAGPNRIMQLRKVAAARGLDPNVWFNNVERVVAEKVGRETVTYVSNIYKYYVAYTLVAQETDEKAKAKGPGDS